jgi:hypothetical protein
VGEEAEFKIRITGDASGVVGASAQSAEALTGVESATKKGTAAYKEMGDKVGLLTEQKHALKLALHQLGNEFPVVGGLTRFLFNPLTAGVAVATVGIKAMADLLGRLKSIEQDTAPIVGMSAAWAVQAAALANLRTEAAAYLRSLEEIKSKKTTPSEEMDAYVKVHQAARIADQSIMDAREAAELKAAEGREEPEHKLNAIREKYAKDRIRRDDEAAKSDLASKDAAQKAEEYRAKKAGEELTEARAKLAGLGSDEGDKKRAEAAKTNYDAQAALVEGLEKTVNGPEGFMGGLMESLRENILAPILNLSYNLQGKIAPQDWTNPAAAAATKLPGEEAKSAGWQKVYEKEKSDAAANAAARAVEEERVRKLEAAQSSGLGRAKALETEIPIAREKAASEIRARHTIQSIEFPPAPFGGGGAAEKDRIKREKAANKLGIYHPTPAMLGAGGQPTESALGQIDAMQSTGEAVQALNAEAARLRAAMANVKAQVRSRNLNVSD